MSLNLKKAILHSAIISLTIALFSYSCYSRLSTTPTGITNNSDAQAQYITASGMTYLIISTPNGVTLTNLTKDSFEVILRKRNEIYLDIANRQSKQK